MAGKVESKKLEEYENEKLLLALVFGKLRMCCHPRWPELEVRAAIVSYLNSSFLAKFRFPVREYMRRCNAVEKHLHSQRYRSVSPSYLLILET